VPKQRTVKRVEYEHGNSKSHVFLSPAFPLIALPLSYVPAISGYTWIVFGLTAFYNFGEMANMYFLRKEMKVMFPEGRDKTELEHKWIREHLFCAVITAALALMVAMFVPALKLYAWIVVGIMTCIGFLNLVSLTRLKASLT
jgi:hypothetical protein